MLICGRSTSARDQHSVKHVDRFVEVIIFYIGHTNIHSETKRSTQHQIVELTYDLVVHFIFLNTPMKVFSYSDVTLSVIDS